MQKCRLTSFFQTRTTALANGLQDFLIAPISGISCKCFFISSNWSGRICLYLSLKGVELVSFTMCLTTEVFPRSRSSKVKRRPNSVIKSLTSFCSWTDKLTVPMRPTLLNSFFKFLRGKWHIFFEKLNFPRELSLLLDKIETKSFSSKKFILWDKNFYLILKVTWTPLLVLILEFYFWTFPQIKPLCTQVHLWKVLKLIFFYIQNTVAFHFHPIL